MIEIDFRSFNRRYLPVLLGAVLLLIAAVAALIVVLRGSQPEAPSEPAAEVTPGTATPTDTPAPTAEGTPTITPTPEATATLEPGTWEVSEGETLLFIIQQFGHRDRSVIPEVLALNNLASEDAIFAGQTLLIPRPTPTPGPTPEPVDDDNPQGGDASEDEAFRGCTLDERCISTDGQYYMHEVESGQTVAGLARAYDTTVQAIQEDNSVGEFINEGQILRIRIMVTLTPTLTPTGGPDSTATPTPTFAPPDTVAPANGARIARSEDVTLQWVPLRPLQGQQAYRVVMRDANTGEELLREVTRATVLRLPDNLRPGAGGSREYLWQVVIVASGNPDADVVGGEGQFRNFIWGN